LQRPEGGGKEITCPHRAGPIRHRKRKGAHNPSTENGEDEW